MLEISYDIYFPINFFARRTPPIRTKTTTLAAIIGTKISEDSGMDDDVLYVVIVVLSWIEVSGVVEVVEIILLWVVWADVVGVVDPTG